SPDGLPIYQQSPTCPGAYLVSCHSGVTLAAAHAMRLPEWFLQRPDAPELEVFGETRFSA
ncbi:MAG: FAD-binding oxidoreductase, partial [Shimia sp.]|nr:FAD-binding oxidoreductase [Shimia sp.]